MYVFAIMAASCQVYKIIAYNQVIICLAIFIASIFRSPEKEKWCLKVNIAS